MANSPTSIGENTVPERTGAPIPKDKRATSLQFLLERIDGVSTVQELAWMNGIPLGKLRKELRELVSLGVVELSGEESDVNSRITTRSDIIDLNKLQEVESSYDDQVYTSQVQAVPERTTPADNGDDEKDAHSALIPMNWPTPYEDYSLRGKWKEFADGQAQENLRLLVYYLENLGEITHYQLLSVEQNASASEVEDAAESLKVFFAPESWESYGEEIITKAAARIHKAISQAFSVLGSAEKRKGYDTALKYLDD